MLLIKNGIIHTITGEVIENGSILIDGKIIKKVGKNIEQNDDMEVIDAKGKIVTPGFIDSHSHLGLWESSIGFEGADGNEAKDPITPHMRAIDAINPMDITFEEARNAGITSTATGPGSANIIGGTFIAIKTAKAKRVEDLIIKDPIAMKCAFGENPKNCYNNQNKMPTTRMAISALFRETLSKAKMYMEKLEQAEGDKSKEPQFDAKLHALIPVLKKEIPIKAHAHRADDIFTALRIANEFDLDITLEHVTEGHLIVEELKEANVGCNVGPSFGHRSKFELKNLSFKTPGVLSKAGVKVAIITDAQVTPLHSLPMMAGLAVKHGMDEKEAFRAVTINPAEIIGISDRVGSLEVGKDADIVIWDGHPFSIDTEVETTIINGKVEYKRN
jgi:imidazolonepropionase-like amidohydrolase